MTAHCVVLAVAPLPVAVLITLVGGDDEDRAHVIAVQAHRVEQVDGPHDVDLIGLARPGNGAPHEGLCSHVDDQSGSARLQRGRHGIGVAHVAGDALHPLTDAGQLEQGRSRGTVGREASNPSAE